MMSMSMLLENVDFKLNSNLILLRMANGSIYHFFGGFSLIAWCVVYEYHLPLNFFKSNRVYWYRSRIFVRLYSLKSIKNRFTKIIEMLTRFTHIIQT